MPQTANQPADVSNGVSDSTASPRAADWLWRRWYAKFLWATTAVYWVGLYGLPLIPDDWQNYYVASAMVLLVFVLNPITVVAALGYGFLKAKVACGDWVVIPGSTAGLAEWLRREREAAYLNPADALSGHMHQQYLDRSKRHPTDQTGL